MVTRLAVVGVALVAVTFPLPQNIQVPLRPGWTPVTWILTRHLCSALVAFRQITGPFLRAHAAHTPHDDQDPPRDSRRHQRGHTPRQGQEEEELLAASSSKATGTHDPSHATEAAAPVPAESTASPTSQPGEPSSQPQRGRSATRRKRGSAAEASEPGQLGVARTVTLAGVGEVTYGELAITQLRRQAAALREEWGSEADFVRQKVGRLIVSQSAPPTQEQIRMWSKWALSRFRVRAPARVREAEQLERLASEILATLEKAGAHLRLSGSPSSPRPGTSEQASRTDSDGGASARMARSENPYPRECVVREWRYQATRNYNIYAKLRTDEAAALEAQAMAWENRLTAGALTQDVPCEGTSGVTQPSERAPKPERTPGRPGALVFLNESRRHNARDVYCARGPARAEEAAGLMNLADDLTKRAAAAGIPLRSSQENTAQAVKSGEHLPSAQGEGPSAGPRHSPATGEHPTTFAHLAIAVLRSEAQFLRPLWYCGEAQAVAQHLALRMVRQGDPSPSPKVQRYWEHTRRECYRHDLRERQEHVRQLEARALALEQELESLLSATRGHEAAPSREAESTGKSSETPKSGKRKAKTKHLSQTPSASAGEGTSSAGEGTSSAGAASMPRSLWLTPVVALPYEHLDRARGGRVPKPLLQVGRSPQLPNHSRRELDVPEKRQVGRR
ncbi:KRUF family protein [Toxoplasma gondii]|uniref:KRUF family protein n=1 Tax=Toxoplasma gondii TaxID=5811 RepID=A0A7J6KDQ3_TOXGO|nr:KRUF family protein [Toxoplasma gondii]